MKPVDVFMVVMVCAVFFVSGMFVNQSFFDGLPVVVTQSDVVLSSDSNSDSYFVQVFPSKQCEGVRLNYLDKKVIVHSTGSMRPYIFSGDIVLSKPYDSSKELVLGDVVSSGGVLHRVNGVKYCDWNTSFESADKLCVDYFTMKGDNNLRSDAKRYKANEIDFVVCGVMRGGSLQ
jgi:hypothetical protein